MTVSPLPTKSSLLLDVSNATLHVTPEQFDLLCIDNPDLRLELTKDGELIVMPPTGGETGKRNLDLTTQVGVWNKQNKLGEAFESSTGYDFTGIGGGKMSPDVSWIEQSQLIGVLIDKFIPVVPDFVIELRSKSDNLKPLQAKMQEYQQLGVRLGLLINPQDRQAEVYRLGQEIEVLESPMSVSCQDVMPGFILSLTDIW
jgi:Uma2 family endonuclease